MDGFRVGDRCVPLENSGRYGLKDWKLQPLRPQDIADGIKRLWVEFPMSESEQEVARLQATIWWANHPTWERTTPITQADLDKYDMPQEYLDGCAVFPKPKIVTEDLWMEHYEAMAAAQTIILPPEKPEDTSATGLYFSELRRGD